MSALSPDSDPAAALLERARRRLRAQDQHGALALLLGAPKRQQATPGWALLVAQAHAEVGAEGAALDALRRAVKAHPKEPGVHAALGQRLAAMGRRDEAEPAFRAALRLEPRHAAGLAGLAQLLEREHRLDEAEALLSRALAGPATEPSVAAVAVRVRAARGDVEGALALGRAVAGPALRESNGARELLFSLARLHERAGDPDRAFACATRANGMLRPPYDPAAWTSLFDRLRAVGDRAWLTRTRAPAQPGAERAVFVVGLPRCGSTLVERMLAAHPRVHGAGEIPTFHAIATALPGRTGAEQSWPDGLAALRPEIAQAAGAEYLEALHRIDTEADRVVNKDLGGYAHLGAIAALLPGARVIHCRRDPLDHCLACYLERLRPSAAPYAVDLRRLGHHYRLYDALMAHWSRELDLAVREVRYEDLVAEPEAHARALIDFLGLPWDDAVLAFDRTARVERTLSHAQVREPVHDRSIGRAALYGARLDPLRAALRGETTPG